MEHRNGLIVARGLRRGVAGEILLAPAIQHLRQAWSEEIEPHFQAEESVLLPAFAAVVGEEDPLVLRTLAEHAAFREQIARLEGATGEVERQLAAEIGTALEAHIRFEERVLFPAIETALAGDALAAVGQALADVQGGRVACRRGPGG